MAAEAAHVANEVVKESILGSFGVNWRIFIAQLVNFSVILFVLWKWVFTPVITALDKRQKTISKGLMDAEKATEARSKAEEAQEVLIISARKEAQGIMEQASVDAEKLRKATLEKTQQEVSEIVLQGKNQLADEKKQIVVDAKKEIAELVVSSTEKILEETKSDARQTGLIQAAVKRLVG